MSNKIPNRYHDFLLVINIFYAPLICLIVYVKNQTDITIINSFYEGLSTATPFLLLINLLIAIEAGYNYVNAPNLTSEIDTKRNLIPIVALLWPLVLVCFLLLLIKKQISFSVFNLESITNLLMNKIDEEQKGLLCDARAEWEQLDLNSQQIKRKEIVFILFLYWGKFLAWYNYENKRPRA